MLEISCYPNSFLTLFPAGKGSFTYPVLSSFPPLPLGEEEEEKERRTQNLTFRLS
jgi:hypothetical protein